MLLMFNVQFNGVESAIQSQQLWNLGHFCVKYSRKSPWHIGRRARNVSSLMPVVRKRWMRLKSHSFIFFPLPGAGHLSGSARLNRLSTWSLNIVHMDSECLSTLVDSVCQTLDMGRADQLYCSVAKSNSVLISSHGCQSFVLTELILWMHSHTQWPMTHTRVIMWTTLVKKMNNIWET